MFSLSVSLVQVLVLVLVRSDDQFPSIQSLARSESPGFSVPQPQLDLEPTSLSVNAPMPMSLPSNISQNIAETDFAKNSPMGFNITQPRLDLVPSFTITGGDGEEYRSEDTEDVEDDTKEKSEPEQLPLEPQIYPVAETVRMRREGGLL